MHRDHSDFLQLYMHLRVCMCRIYMYVSLSLPISCYSQVASILVSPALFFKKKIRFLNLLSSHMNFRVSLSMLMLILDRILIGNASCLW